jgi:hypothetical protein
MIETFLRVGFITKGGQAMQDSKNHTVDFDNILEELNSTEGEKEVFDKIVEKVKQTGVIIGISNG